MDKRRKKKIEKRLGYKLDEDQIKDLLKKEDLKRYDFEFVTIPENEREGEKKFDIKIKSDSEYKFNLKAKFFKKVLTFTIKRK